MSDCERLLALLEERAERGVHSHEIRRMAISGHPSQRAKELEAKGYPIRREREFVGNRPGVRFYLEESAGVGAGVPSPQGRASVDPGEGSSGASMPTGAKAPKGPMPASPEKPARLFPPPPQHPLRDQEAA